MLARRRVGQQLITEHCGVGRVTVHLCHRPFEIFGEGLAAFVVRVKTERPIEKLDSLALVI